MQQLLRRLGDHAREKFVVGMCVLLLVVIGLTILLLKAPEAATTRAGQSSSAAFATTATVGATGTPSKHHATGTPTAFPTQTSTGTPTTVPVTGGLIDTYANVHLGLSFDYNVSNFASLQGKVDIVWAAGAPQSVPGAFVMSYNPSDRIGDGDNGPLYSIDWFKQHHPDWIVYKCDQATPAYSFGEPNTPLDITNPQVLQFLMAQEIVPQIKAGYQGIGFDNIGPNNSWERCGHFDAQHHWVPLYSGLIHDLAFQQSVLSWGKAMYSMIKQASAQMKVAMNFSFDYQSWNFWGQMLANVDFVTDEGGFTNFGAIGFPYVADSEWSNYIAFLQSVQSQNKGLFEIDEEPNTAVSSAQMQWALANYLLVKGHSTYLTVVGYQQYGQFYDHPEYHIQIGSPTGAMTSAGCASERPYTHGIAIVNSSSTMSCTVTLPHAYKTLAGATVSTLNMAAHSGAVLLNG